MVPELQCAAGEMALLRIRGISYVRGEGTLAVCKKQLHGAVAATARTGTNSFAFFFIDYWI
jgi:hypothetical protein